MELQYKSNSWLVWCEMLVFLSFSRAMSGDENYLGFYQSGSGSGQSADTSTRPQTQPNMDALIKFIGEKDQKLDRIKRVKPFFEFLSYYKRKVYPDKLDEALVDAIEHHIEEIEPQFRSGSFAQLWNTLRVPLTQFFRPQSSGYLLEELASCLYGNRSRANRSKLPDAIEDVRRDLIICKIAQILEDSESQRPAILPGPVFDQLWTLLRGPMTPLLIADLRTMFRELAQYTSRFEMAGIQYQLPGKMSEIRRDVVICKVDDVFNALYDTNAKELEKDL